MNKLIWLVDWIKSWFNKPTNMNIEEINKFHPEKRNLYSYWDGEREIKTDPMVLYKRLMPVWPEICKCSTTDALEGEGALQSHNTLISRIREVFYIKPFEEGGLTENECTHLLDHFWVFTESLTRAPNKDKKDG